MTTTEQDKDEGIDEIINMNIPPEHKVHYIADLAKHRGKCMDEDAIRIYDLKQANALLEGSMKGALEVIGRLQEARSPWCNFKIWLNGWAKS